MKRYYSLLLAALFLTINGAIASEKQSIGRTLTNAAACYVGGYVSLVQGLPLISTASNACRNLSQYFPAKENRSGKKFLLFGKEMFTQATLDYEVKSYEIAKAVRPGYANLAPIIFCSALVWHYKYKNMGSLDQGVVATIKI